ncbi:MAG: glycoside hydrolase family 10 protein, partial [Planctomyces sp.]
MNTRTWHPGLSLVLTLILSMLLPRVASAQTPAGAAPNAALSAWMATTDPKDNPPAIPREFRGVWVATVANIDWPSKKGLPSDQQQAEMRRILDRAVELKLNAILLQVRPSCDAIYPSSLEPWSEFLTGQSGKPPSPEYDPLAMWIEEAHARGLELHAWVNPFRSRHFRAEGPDAANHINIARPDLVRKYDNLLWLDPGEPEAQEHSLRVIMDLVNRYDLDGVHYDDYFYPYPKDNVPFPDDAPFARARAAGETRSKADWRRANIDNFVRRLYEEIKK